MKMWIRLTKQPGAPRSGLPFDDREQREVLGVGQQSIKNMDAISGAGGRIDIGRNARGTAEKSTYSDRTDAVVGPRSSIDRPLQIGVAAIWRVDGLVLLHADGSAAIRIATLD